MKFISINGIDDERKIVPFIKHHLPDVDKVIILNENDNSFSNLINELNNANYHVITVNKYNLIKKISEGLDEIVICSDRDIESLILELDKYRSQSEKYVEFLKIKDENIKYLFSRSKKYDQMVDALNKLRNQQHSMTKQLTNRDFRIETYKNRLIDKEMEIDYLNNRGIMTLLNSFLFSYIYIILKSKPNDIFINIRLFRFLKDNPLFDKGFYLRKYPEIISTKCCRFFSLELHFVCFGFDENKKFSKDYFYCSNKKQLLDLLKIK